MSYGNELTAADVAAVTHNGGYGGYGGFGGFGGDGGWLAILFILALFGGFGGNRGGFGAGGACATPLDVHTAVDQQTLLSKLDNQTYGIADATFALNNTIRDGFYSAEISRRDMAADAAKCCCETQRLIERSVCDITHQMCNNTRDIIDNNNCNTRAILDFLIQDKLATKDARIAQLENALSRSEQNGFIRATIDASTAEIIRRTGNEIPNAAYLVPNPHCCNNTCGYGYGYGYNG